MAAVQVPTVLLFACLLFCNTSGSGSSPGPKVVCFPVSSVKSVQQQDAGQYWCEVEFHGLTFSSQRAWITVEGEDPKHTSQWTPLSSAAV